MKNNLLTIFKSIKGSYNLIDFAQKSKGKPLPRSRASIKKEYEILIMCKVGQRSQFVAQLLEKENYKCTNISDGFDGWKSSDLPCL